MRASILIATRNRLAQLRHGLRSIVGMGYPDVEIIVVDDGSTDGTREHCLGLGDAIKYHRIERAGRYRKNPSDVLNFGHAMCQSDVVIEQGGEVVHVNDCVTPLVDACQHGRVALARVFNGTGADLPAVQMMESMTPDVEPDPADVQVFAGRWKVPKVGGVDLFCGLERQVPFLFLGAIHKMDFDEAGGYNPSVTDGNDTNLARSLLANGVRFRWLGSAVALHLSHGKS